MQKFRVFFWDVIPAEGEKPGENPLLRKDLGVFRHATNEKQPLNYQIARAFAAVAQRASIKLDEQDFDGVSSSKKAVNHLEIVHVESGAVCFFSVEKKIVIDRTIDFYDVPAAPEGLAQSIFGQCLLTLNERPIGDVLRRFFRLLGQKGALPRNVLLELKRLCGGRLFVIDHHRTAQASLEGLDSWLSDGAEKVTAAMVQKFYERSGGEKPGLATERATLVKKEHARKRTKSDEAAQADSP